MHHALRERSTTGHTVQAEEVVEIHPMFQQGIRLPINLSGDSTRHRILFICHYRVTHRQEPDGSGLGDSALVWKVWTVPWWINRIAPNMQRYLDMLREGVNCSNDPLCSRQPPSCA